MSSPRSLVRHLHRSGVALLLAGLVSCGGAGGEDGESSLELAASSAATPSVPSKVVPTAAQTFRGWGMALAWEANDVYGSSLVPQKISVANQPAYMDLLYGDPEQRLTLGLTVARYNIGGGDAPHHAHMRPDAQMEGFQAGKGQPFDFTRDGSQRRMLHEAQQRGANIFEAFSNSPPYWMTNSGCASGSTTGSADNISPAHYADFVNYLVTVVKYFASREGLVFESLEPFNEPDGNWWKAQGSQEGTAAAPATQQTLIPMVAQALRSAHLPTIVSASDTNDLDKETKDLGLFDAAAVRAIGRINTHTYAGQNRAALKAKAATLRLPVWTSEVGCCLGSAKSKVPNDRTPMWGALWMADTVRLDLRDMGSQVWVFWQPDWNLIAFDHGAPAPEKQYYALAQYTNYIRPGFRIISAGADNTLAAYSPSAKRLVLVSTNWDSATTNDFDLTSFSDLPAFATQVRTTADSSVNLQQQTLPVSAQGRIVDTLPVRSVTTYILDGVTER